MYSIWDTPGLDSAGKETTQSYTELLLQAIESSNIRHKELHSWHVLRESYKSVFKSLLRSSAERKEYFLNQSSCILCRGLKGWLLNRLAVILLGIKCRAVNMKVKTRSAVSPNRMNHWPEDRSASFTSSSFTTFPFSSCRCDSIITMCVLNGGKHTTTNCNLLGLLWDSGWFPNQGNHPLSSQPRKPRPWLKDHILAHILVLHIHF